MSEVLSRIEAGDRLDQLLPQVAVNHDIGDLVDWQSLAAGLEDCNIKLSTKSGEYLLKVFAKTREPSDVSRYVEIIEHISGNPGITTQQIIESREGESFGHLEDDTDPYVLLSWLDGKTFYDLGRQITDGELADLIFQTAAIHSIDYKPEYLYDSWEVGNIKGQYQKARPYLDDAEAQLAEKAAQLFKNIDHKSLPHAFVHGDLTKQNVLALGDDKVGLIDFAVANWYPRIQDLAVIIANLLFKEGLSVDEAARRVIGLYESHATLSKEEKSALTSYSIAAMAMEFLGGIVEKHENGSELEEIDYWINLGRKSLQANLQ